MPFTISHIAAVLPFARVLARWRLLSATIIGSMVPDFGFLMPWRPARVETHSAIGLLTFCLPVGIATFWIFQRLIKTPILEILPDAAYVRWQPFAAPADIGSVRQWVFGACGIIVGALTHLVWDAFTHEGARGVRMIPVLDDPILDIAGHHLAGARLLQDLSSLVGLAVVFLVAGYGLRKSAASRPARRMLRPVERLVWIVTYATVALILGAVFLVLRRHVAAPGQSLALLVGNYAIASLRGFATAVLLVSLCLGLRLRARPRSSSRSPSS